MDLASLLSACSLVAVMIYLYIGIYTYKQNSHSKIHRVFLSLCTSYAIWSFAYAFAYVSRDRYVFSFWNKLSAIGWCSISAISLYLVLLITENRFAKKEIAKFVIFSPAVFFFYLAVFQFGAGVYTPPLVVKLFYIGDFLYDFIFLSACLVILYVWGLQANNTRVKKQSRILVLSSIIPFGLNLLTQSILPLFGVKIFPLMGQLYAMIMVIGIYIVITKYKFLRIPEKYILEEIANEMMDMFILLNEKGEFIRMSRHTLDMLGYEKDELLKQNIHLIVDEKDSDKISINHLKQRDKKHLDDIALVKKNGERIPVHISYIPIYDRVLHDFLGAVLVMRDISIICKLRKKNEELQNKAIRDSLTKLYNHQYCMQLIQEEEMKTKLDGNQSGLTVMMLDIDHFKRVNDTYGHLFGDYVIKTVSDILVHNIHENGYVGRFGGEEFIIILPNIEINEAYQLGESIRSEIEAYEFESGLKLTISIGLKQLQDESSVELVKNVDDLLYKAKQNGRNRIEYSCC